MQFDPGMEYRPDYHGMKRPNPLGGPGNTGSGGGGGGPPSRGMNVRGGPGLPPPIIPVGLSGPVASGAGGGGGGVAGGSNQKAPVTNTAPLGTGQLPSKDDKS